MDYYILDLSGEQALFWTENMKEKTPSLLKAGRFCEDAVIADLERFDNGLSARAVLVDRIHDFIMSLSRSSEEVRWQIEGHRRQIIRLKKQLKQLESGHARIH